MNNAEFENSTPKLTHIHPHVHLYPLLSPLSSLPYFVLLFCQSKGLCEGSGRVVHTEGVVVKDVWLPRCEERIWVENMLCFYFWQPCAHVQLVTPAHLHVRQIHQKRNNFPCNVRRIRPEKEIVNWRAYIQQRSNANSFFVRQNSLPQLIKLPRNLI